MQALTLQHCFAQPFSIDSEGVVSNTEPLDFEKSHNHILSVVAYDCGMKRSQPVMLNVKVNRVCHLGWKGKQNGSCLKTGQHVIFVIIRKIKNGYTYVGYHKLMILYSLWSNIFSIRIIIIIIGNKKINSIFDTKSKIIHFMGSNWYIITKIKCWPLFKQDPTKLFWWTEMEELCRSFNKKKTL